MPRPPLPAASPFEDLYREHAPGLLRLIRSKTSDVASADDVLQETFVRFLRFYIVPGRLDPSRPVGPLLATIAIRETARRGRALDRQRRLDSVAWSPAPPAAVVGSDEHVAALHRQAIVQAALQSLDPRQRRLLLEWVARRSTESLAASEQVSVAALKQVVVRARRNFRERYQETTGLAWLATPFAHLIVRLRARLRLDPTRHDMVATGLGLAACSVAFVTVVVGSGPLPSRAAEVVPDRTTSLATPPPAGPAVAGVRGTARRPASTPVVETVRVPRTDTRSPVESASVSDNRAMVELDVDDSQGNTRSIRELTIKCDAGVTTKSVCTAVDQVPPDLSGQGDP